MQTFLPYDDFERTAEVLDSKRLGKQRVETLQVMQVLLHLRWNPDTGRIESFAPKGWRRHPVVWMWRGHETTLADYQQAICAEWTARGFGDTCDAKTRGLLAEAARTGPVSTSPPPWLGDDDLHRSHQSNLIRKDPLIYRPLFPEVPDDLPYIWPVEVPPLDTATGD